MSDEGRLDAERVVGWYRLDDTRRIVRVVIPMAIAMAIGSAVVGLAFTRLDALDPSTLNATRTPPPPSGRVSAYERETESQRDDSLAPAPVDAPSGVYRRAPAPAVRRAEIPGSVWALFALGFLLVAMSVIALLAGLGQLWKRELYLLLRVDALVHQSASGHHRVAWDDVARVVHEDGVVRLRMRDESEPYEIRERYAGLDPEALAARLEELRRKASFGLIR